MGVDAGGDADVGVAEEDGTILVGRSSSGIHAEEDLIQQAGKRKITDLYSECEPCANKCEKLVRDMNVSWSYRWTGVDRDASNEALNKAIKDLFNSP